MPAQLLRTGLTRHVPASPVTRWGQLLRAPLVGGPLVSGLFSSPACGIAALMAAAEAAWRQSLATVTIADIVASLPRELPERTRALLARPH
jgi:hypothetical protein